MRRSASTVTRDTSAASVSSRPSEPVTIMDFGRKRLRRFRVDFFMPRPNFLSMMDADEAVDEMDMLSVDAMNSAWPE